MQENLESLQQRRQEWIDSVNRGDVDAYSELLTEDAVWIPPGRDPVVGKQAFRAWLAPFFSQFTYDFSTDEERIRIAGDWAVERAHFTSDMSPKGGGEPMRHSGTYILLWRRDEGSRWCIERYIDDSEMSTGTHQAT